MADALKKVAEHKKALEEAEKIEQEFMTLVTGHRNTSDQGTKIPEASNAIVLLIGLLVFI